MGWNKLNVSFLGNSMSAMIMLANNLAAVSTCIWQKTAKNDDLTFTWDSTGLTHVFSPYVCLLCLFSNAPDHISDALRKCLGNRKSNTIQQRKSQRDESASRLIWQIHVIMMKDNISVSVFLLLLSEKWVAIMIIAEALRHVTSKHWHKSLKATKLSASFD